MCQKAYSASPTTEERRAGRTSSLCESSRSMSVTSVRSRSPIAATAPAQKTFPMMAASESIDFVSADSVSRRAAIRAWIESGNGTSALSRSSQLTPFLMRRSLSLSRRTNSSA